jgi:hypothetical protein
MTLQVSRQQVALIAICSVLGAGLLYEVFAPLPAYSVPSARVGAIAVPAPPPAFAAPAIAAFAPIADRPLFDPQRRKFVPPPTVSAAAAPPPPPDIALVGVILDGANKLAIVRASNAALATSMAVGESIGGWQLSSIEADRIILHAGTLENVIRLDANRGIATPQQPNTPQQQRDSQKTP